MKLHLPKVLLVTMLAIPVMGANLNNDNITAGILDVGLGSATDTWSGDIKVGTWKDSTGDVTAIGALNGTSIYSSNQLGANTYTDTLKVTGSVTVQGEGQVILGGKQSSSQYGGIIANQVTVGAPISEEKVPSSDNPYLFASMANIANLVVNSGTVDMGGGSDCYTGNSSMSESGKKLAQVSHSLTVNGGTVTLGQYHSNYYKADHAQTALGRYEGGTFKAATVTQSKGNIVAKGYTLTASGLNISQTGGTMEFQGPLAFFGQMFGNDSTTIIQQDATEKGTKLTINGMVEPVYSLLNGGYKPDKMAINITQKGIGTIELKNGIQIATSSVGLISQEGDGVIDLSGEFKPKFNIEQKASGTITLKENATISADTVTLTNVNVTDTSKPQGGLVIEKGATLTADSINIDGGKLENRGTVKGDIHIGTVATTFSLLARDVEVTTGQVVNSGTIEGAITMSGGALVLEDGSSVAGLSATGGEIQVEGNVIMTDDLVLDGDADLIFEDSTATINLGEHQLDLKGGNIAVTLTDEELANLANVNIALFTGADENAVDWGSQEVSILNTSGQQTNKAVLNFTGNAKGDVTITVVPEPATTTLSLLALMALASRRRRK